jgi:amino acid transporter
VVFLVPTALVAAELATGWQGGVYVWVREATGNRWGFVAIWLQWIQNVVWYPVQLAFIAAAVAFMVGSPDLANSGLFTAAVITVVIAALVPPSQLGLTTGIMLAFEVFFDHIGIHWGTYVLAGMIAVGALASVITWIAGPSKGLLLAGETGVLPRWMQRRNKAGIQEGILVVQGAIVSLLALLSIVIPNVSAAFFTLVDMAGALYLIMYCLMFAAAIRLRRLEPEVERAYRVPAINLVAGTGLAASILALALSFVPPQGPRRNSQLGLSLRDARGDPRAQHPAADPLRPA